MMEASLQERLDMIDVLAKEKSDMAGQFHEAKIADEILINQLKLKVNIFLNWVIF